MAIDYTRLTKEMIQLAFTDEDIAKKICNSNLFFRGQKVYHYSQAAEKYFNSLFYLSKNLIPVNLNGKHNHTAFLTNYWTEILEKTRVEIPVDLLRACNFFKDKNSNTRYPHNLLTFTCSNKNVEDAENYFNIIKQFSITQLINNKVSYTQNFSCNIPDELIN